MIGADELLTRCCREIAEKDQRIEQLEAQVQATEADWVSAKYDFAVTVQKRDERIEQLEAEVRALREAAEHVCAAARGCGDDYPALAEAITLLGVACADAARRSG